MRPERRPEPADSRSEKRRTIFPKKEDRPALPSAGAAPSEKSQGVWGTASPIPPPFTLHHHLARSPPHRLPRARSIVVTHSGGLPGGLAPSAQWASLQTSGDTPLPPVFTAIEASPSGTNMLLTFTADPGAYFHLLTSTNLVNWQTNATVKAEAVTNSVLVAAPDPYRFWLLRRQQ